MNDTFTAEMALIVARQERERITKLLWRSCDTLHIMADQCDCAVLIRIIKMDGENK